jgi:hypothetical protein
MKTVKIFKETGVQFIAYMCDAASLVEYYKEKLKKLREV